jgi:hypothetical protein
MNVVFSISRYEIARRFTTQYQTQNNYFACFMGDMTPNHKNVKIIKTKLPNSVYNKLWNVSHLKIDAETMTTTSESSD